MTGIDNGTFSFLESSSVEQQGPVKCLGMTFENDERRRAYFLEQLRKKLSDPEFRKTEGFPIGKEEDILALSDPPYYTACPNPFVEEFVKQFGRKYDPNTPYNREPFATDVSEGKNDPVYNAHGYHTKVSYLAVRRYISHFTEPGDLVLDLFAGTGMTGVAAQQCVDGERKCILNDLSSIASHVAGAFTSPFSLNWARPIAQQALAKVRSQYSWMYETKHCGWHAGERDPQNRLHQIRSSEEQRGEINFVVWSDIFLCPQCGININFWEVAVDFNSKRIQDEFSCPNCHVWLRKRGLPKAMTTVYDNVLNQSHHIPKQEPVLINYTFNRTRFEKEPDEEDKKKLEMIEKLPIEGWIPTEPVPPGDKTRELRRLGISNIHHMYTRRNLRTLTLLRQEASKHRALLFWFTSTLPWCSRENRLLMSNYFEKKGGVIGGLRGTWYVPSLSIETNVLERFRLRLKSALVESGSRNNGCIVSTGSATKMQGLPDNSVDYIFVDPPFGDNLMYSELNCVWEAWLKVKTDNKSEAIINRSQEKGLNAYQEIMTKAFQEGYRALKPGRWITIEFHNSKNRVWNAIQEALLTAGFVVADTRTLDKHKGSFNQVTAAGSVRQDLIISAYKPNDGFESRFCLSAGSEEGVWDFVRTHLKQLPVFVSKDGQAEIIGERQNYLLFDRMVAFHVQRGVTVPLSAAGFYAGLEQRFPFRDGMYFLPDQVAEYDRKRMTVKEVLQLQLFVSDEASAIQWLKQQFTKRPQTFQDIHPQFLQEIGGWQKHERLPELSELLEQNFLRYDGDGEVPSQIHSYLSSNFREFRNLRKNDLALRAKSKDRWYVPNPNRAGDLENLREKALMREFQEYRKAKQKRLKVFRLEAVRAGFKKAWQERDYTTIISVARKIPETILHEDPKLLMWYDQATIRTGSG